MVHKYVRTYDLLILHSQLGLCDVHGIATYMCLTYCNCRMCYLWGVYYIAGIIDKVFNLMSFGKMSMIHQLLRLLLILYLSGCLSMNNSWRGILWVPLHFMHVYIYIYIYRCLFCFRVLNLRVYLVQMFIRTILFMWINTAVICRISILSN